MPGVTQINQNEILLIGGFAISSALKGLFQVENGGADGLGDSYIINLIEKSISRLDNLGSSMDASAALERRIHPWVIVTRRISDR